MKIRNFLLLIFLFFIFQVSYAQNETTNTTTMSESIGTISLSYSIVGEVTNLNPYSVFVAIPDEYIEIEDVETLPIPSSGIIPSTIDCPDTTSFQILKPKYLCIFNKKIGFWLPPYTTAKIKLSVYDYNMTININAPTENNFRVIGPAVVNSYKVISIKDLFPNAKKEHIKLENFKLYVNGYLEIYKDYSNENITSSGDSIILPLPLAFKDYKNINIIDDNGIWINYYDWYHNFINIKNSYINNELNDYNSDFDPTLTDDDLIDSNLNMENKYFPAMAFTVSDSSGKIRFYYIIEWKNNNDMNIELPDFI
ncbi:conserved exported protein of unknown function [Methanocaldococcus lauensis]|uniref:Uncharacterized protein n=1 Tax=Methanocaldococcus lauensis TaxID=2546128 RepID=A0A8D6SWG2_9EURY|nr:hypothetical protein [Methanocaldococcus lauensis]CAB3287668.1 conserved exported protein of unknown function [Methanocaldococcus lauensis]